MGWYALLIAFLFMVVLLIWVAVVQGEKDPESNRFVVITGIISITLTFLGMLFVMSIK